MLTGVLVLFLLSVTDCILQDIEFNPSYTKIIIDNDAGADDAMAIFLALQFEKYFNGPHLIGLTTVNGNTREENVYVNNQKILKVADRQDIPIYRGSKSSLVSTPEGGNYFGEDGLGDSNDVYTDLKPAKEEPAVLWLLEQSRIHMGSLVVISIGPSTNIAMAVNLDPDFINRLAQLYIGGGNINSEENQEVEFNVYMDVEAYHVIAQNALPGKVTFIPFSQIKSSLNFSKEWRQEELGKVDSDIMRAMNKFERISLPKEDRWQALDPAVVVSAVTTDLVKEYKHANNNIILCGDQRGKTVNTFVAKKEAKVRVLYSFKTEEYKKFLLEVFSASNQTINVKN